MEENKYFELITKYLTGSITEAENKLLQTWTETDEKNMNLFKELKKLWELSAKYESDFEPDLHQAIDRFKTRIASTPESKTVRIKRYLQIAAVFILIALSVVTVKYFISDKSDVSITKLTASANSNAEFILPDSSRIWLNKNSEISYADNFSDRVITLKGEAYFEVRKLNGKPFTILSGKSKTVVLGTSFVVKNIEKSQNVAVVVLTGKVALSDISDNSNHKAVLNPGEQGTFNSQNSTISIIKTDDPNVLAWKTKVLTFQNTSVQDVFRTLEQFYNKQFIIEDGSMNDCVLTSTFDHQNLTDILEELRILWNIEYSQKGDTFYINRGGC